jgi:ribosomal protein S6--L-glutamate ligase
MIRRVRFLILSRKGSLYSTRRLREEAARLGHEAELLDPLRCVLLLRSKAPAMLVGGRELKRPDAAIPRVGQAGLAYSIAVVRHLDLMGVPLLNNHGPIARAKNKLGCLQLLASKGIPVPDTLMSRYPRDLDRLMKLVGGPPLVMKLLRGTQGTGVIFAESRASVESMLETIWSLGEDILLQRFVAEAKGRDLRVLVVEGRVRAAMRRIGAEGEFRSNIHRGGKGERVRLGKDYERTAVAATKTLGLDVAGVDLLETSTGPQVLEVNASPGFEGLEEATGENVARMLVQAAARKARGRRR